MQRDLWSLSVPRLGVSTGAWVNLCQSTCEAANCLCHRSFQSFALIALGSVCVHAAICPSRLFLMGGPVSNGLALRVLLHCILGRYFQVSHGRVRFLEVASGNVLPSYSGIGQLAVCVSVSRFLTGVDLYAPATIRRLVFCGFSRSRAIPLAVVVEGQYTAAP